jgi:large subunit ribosomal protein L29
MKYKELVRMGKEELNKKQEELEMELIKLNAQVATGTAPKSPGQIKQIKKTLAKIQIIKNQTEEKVKE